MDAEIKVPLVQDYFQNSPFKGTSHHSLVGKKHTIFHMNFSHGLSVALFFICQLILPKITNRYELKIDYGKP